MSDIKRQLNRLREDEKESGSRGSSIRDQLNRLYRRSGRQQKHFPEEEVSRAHKRLEELVPGEYVNTHFGDVFRARNSFPATEAHGTCLLEEFFEVNPANLAHFGRFGREKEPDLRNALFLDTEASGLSGGTGTYAFMVGLGYFHRDEFVIDQLFVENYAKEEGMLDLLSGYLESASLLVTFNGKSFDLNLLETRYLMHGQEAPFEEITHLDLLHPSRNLWDLTLENCKLQTLEREILEFTREDDIPGEEVPGVYFEFIRTGDPTRIAGVFQHNLIDILSLVTVTIMLEGNFTGERNIQGENGLTMFSRGKMYERQGEIERALECYNAALEQNLTHTRRYTVLDRMALIHKRRECWTEAADLWQRQIESTPFYTMDPYVELAKYYEHQVHDYREAGKFVVRALDALPSYREEDRQALEYRLNRIRRKIQGDS